MRRVPIERLMPLRSHTDGRDVALADDEHATDVADHLVATVATKYRRVDGCASSER